MRIRKRQCPSWTKGFADALMIIPGDVRDSEKVAQEWLKRSQCRQGIRCWRWSVEL